MRRRELLQSCALLPLLAAVPKALAHRSHVTLTRLARNTRAGTWEWTHQVHFHDAVVALELLLAVQVVQAAVLVITIHQVAQQLKAHQVVLLVMEMLVVQVLLALHMVQAVAVVLAL